MRGEPTANQREDGGSLSGWHARDDQVDARRIVDDAAQWPRFNAKKHNVQDEILISHHQLRTNQRSE
jgi:hypothetical protein